jgi:hypothetical protein
LGCRGNADVEHRQPDAGARYCQGSPAKRAPEIGEHNEAVLEELKFDPKAIDGFRHSKDGEIARRHGNLTREQQKWLRTRTLARTPNEQSKRA